MRSQRISVRNVADLARAGFEIARQPVTQVDFEVHHALARHGYLRELVSANSDSTVFLETLCSATNGAGVVIGTRTRKPLDGTEVVERVDGHQPAERPEQNAGGWVFHQTTSPNPTFIYESAQRFEGLIGIDPGAREVSEWHGLAIRDLVREISDAASSLIDAPLLSLQCPAQLPTVVKTRNHDLRTRKEIASPCASLAVRFAIALRDASAAARFELADRFRELCEKHGYSFWLADTRPGHRQGNWFEVSHADGEFSPLYKGDLRSRQRVGAVLPVTFVGPARIGSTNAIASFLQRYPQVGVVGCAATTLSDVAFVHLQLAIHGVATDRLNRILGKLLGEATTPARPTKLLRELFKRLGLPPDPDGPGPSAKDPTSDYQTFTGPAFAYRPFQMPDCMAVWVSWEIARQHQGLAAPLDCLYRALAQVAPRVSPETVGSAGDLATVEYLICRATEQSVVRGKAKLAVPKSVLRQFSSGGVELPASKLCAALEEAWKAHVDQSGVDGVSELTVAWRESWLGHWTYS
ncbi:hypothetical protein Amsp01_038080 [Amycolatopsis sp. NBRC 101858]|uniref:hypothetical protein n=1 Tax=Amycolatopsis sp. NBRC 101858 TaxID=3032200 RepID=UPI0024A5600D|nr:hypothetical protein [Amycolatopsis sp. NBRC 101858]GLY37784.1 hypothetical protein Amsp01_038080 [Amycolatopsis sp. NBRC 101858]